MSIDWTLKKVNVSDLKEWKKNPRKLIEKKLQDLQNSIAKFGIAEPIVINTDLTICGGHGRKKVLEKMGIKEVDCYIPNRELSEKEFEELNVRLNRNIAGDWDMDILANEFELDELIEWGFDESELNIDVLEPSDLSDKNKEIDTENFGNDLQHICPSCGFEFND
jgi:ParB-like chromosome segregation protein Spo0J